MYPAHWIKASDADREAIVAQLGEAAAEGRLTLEEFSARTQQAYASRTWGELSSLVGDLPTLPKPSAPPTVVAPQPAGGSDSRLLPLLALILGIASIPASFCVPTGGVAGVVAVVVGILALRSVGKGEPGRGLAAVGLICGLSGLALQAAVIVLITIID
ncbi:DUF1707 domain-containing protein [Dactylosporangium sp. NPDC051541]|uniref:DUF1707 domain-containing protein n=1 Tax=Dactylosporangium sp. NPDC051541 TaxID=3363977 RepID=UPI0037A62FD1